MGMEKYDMFCEFRVSTREVVGPGGYCDQNGGLLQ